MKNTDEMSSGGKREGAGRPPKEMRAFSGTFTFRCSHAERVAWERTAKVNGKPLSDWVRDALNQAAK